jgi:hypothetical protein
MVKAKTGHFKTVLLQYQKQPLTFIDFKFLTINFQIDHNGTSFREFRLPFEHRYTEGMISKGWQLGSSSATTRFAT